MADQRCKAGTEAESDTLSALLDKALSYPAPGAHIGGGRHVAMPATWDGQGATPLGWTKRAVPVWVKDSATAWVPIPDTLATVLQGPPAQARLTGPERAALASAIGGRVMVDLETQGATPKANAAQGAAERAQKP